MKVDSVVTVYRGLGLSVPYPENWKVSADNSDDEADTVFIQSPHTAFMSLSRYADSPDPLHAIQQATEIMESEYEDIESEEIEIQLNLQDVLGRELRFFHLDLVVVSRLIAFRHGDATFLVQQQAEDREFESLDQVFHAMMFGMASSLDAQT